MGFLANCIEKENDYCNIHHMRFMAPWWKKSVLSSTLECALTLISASTIMQTTLQKREVNQELVTQHQHCGPKVKEAAYTTFIRPTMACTSSA